MKLSDGTKFLLVLALGVAVYNAIHAISDFVYLQSHSHTWDGLDTFPGYYRFEHERALYEARVAEARGHFFWLLVPIVYIAWQLGSGARLSWRINRGKSAPDAEVEAVPLVFERKGCVAIFVRMFALLVFVGMPLLGLSYVLIYLATDGVYPMP